MTPTIRKILMPTDFGPSSTSAAAYAGALARGLGASVHLVHVREQPAVGGIWQFPNSRPATPDDQHYYECRERLAVLAATLQHATDRITLEVRTGTPWKAIVDAAVDYGADLIVMSAPPAHGAVPSVMGGSVAERVIRAAPCPVVAVRRSGAAQVHARPRVA